MLTYILIFCTGLLAARLLTHARYASLKHRNGCKDPPPYPHRDPIWGTDLFLKKMRALSSGSYLQTSTHFHKLFKSKTFMTNVFGNTTYHTIDPEVVKSYQSTFFGDFGYEPLRFHIAENLWGNGIAVADGQTWASARSIIRGSFDVVHTANLDRLEYHVQRFLDLIPRDGSTVDLLPLFKRLVSGA